MSDGLSVPEQTPAPSKPMWRKRLSRWIGKVREKKRRRLGDAKRNCPNDEDDGDETVHSSFEQQQSWIGELIRFERRHDTKDDVPARVVSERSGFEKGIPTLESWEQLGDGSIYGKIYGSDEMKDGVWLTTSPVITGCVKSWVFVRCASGERYFLGSSHVGSTNRPMDVVTESWLDFADTNRPALLCIKQSHSMDFTETTDVSGRRYSEYTDDSIYTIDTYEESSHCQSASSFQSESSDSRRSASSSFASESSGGAWALHSLNVSSTSSRSGDCNGGKGFSWMTFCWCF